MRINFPAGMVVLFASVSGLTQDHPSGALNGGGGTASASEYALIGSVHLGTTNTSEGGSFSLQGGVIVGVDRSLMFIDGFE